MSNYFRHFSNILLFLTLIISTSEYLVPKTPMFPVVDNLLYLNDKTSQEAEENYDYLFVIFMVPWNEEYQQYITNIQPFIKELKEAYPNIGFAQINCAIHRNLYVKYDYPGYGRIVLGAQGKKIDTYKGEITFDSINEFIDHRLIPSVIPIDSAKSYEKYLSNIKYKPLLCYFGKDFNELQALEKVAIESQRNYEFIKIESDDLRAQLKYKYRELVLFKSYDENQISITGTDSSPLSYEMIKHFLKKYGHPLIMEYDEKTKSYLFDQNNSFIFFLRKGTQQMNEIMNSVAFFTREKLQTISVNIDNPFSLHFQRQIGIKQVPSVLLVDLRGIPKMYLLEKNSTNSHEPIIQFVNNWDKGKVPKKYIKLPGELKGSVLPLTEDTFMKEVIENDKDVFVKFYAPWCGHCKKLAPIYEELSDKLKANKKLVIAEMDATINHVPSVVIKSYPTLFLYAKDKKDKPIQFNGENTVKGMEKFLRQNAGNALY